METGGFCALVPALLTLAGPVGRLPRWPAERGPRSGSSGRGRSLPPLSRRPSRVAAALGREGHVGLQGAR